MPVKSFKKLSSRRSCYIVFDSPGLKVYREGEWKVGKHGSSKRRNWRKLHIGMNPDSKEIIISELTTNGVGSGDSEIGKKLIERLPKGMGKLLGDGAYDDISFRRSAKNNGADVIVSAPRNAALRDIDDLSTKGLLRRTEKLNFLFYATRLL
jgi:hypothetical protein